MALLPARLDLDALRSVRRALVVGMGRSGQEAARLLLQLGVETVKATDLNPDAARVPGTVPVYGSHERSDFLEADLIVVSPGVPGDMTHLEIATGHGVPVVGELGLAAAVLHDPSVPGGPPPLLAVTGTNGKSSTCWLLGQLLEQAGFHPFVGGNLGAPLSLLAQARLAGDLQHDAGVVEVSSYQLERPGPLRPVAAAVLNLTPDHLARHGDMHTYAAAKLALFQRMGADALAVLPAADPWLPAAAVQRRPTPPRLQLLGGRPGAWAAGEQLIFEGTGDDGRLALAGFPLPGVHNRSNLAVAMLLAAELGVDRAALDLSALRPLPHRLEPVPSTDGRRWINDSKATNVDAAVVGIQGSPAGATILVGGAGKAGADYRALGEALAQQAARVLCFGRSGQEIHDAIHQYITDIPSETLASLDAAVGAAAAQTPPGGAIVLCPACASFDEFRNFEHRGEHFAQLARAAEAPTNGGLESP